jgi:hypothetical protein
MRNLRGLIIFVGFACLVFTACQAKPSIDSGEGSESDVDSRDDSVDTAGRSDSCPDSDSGGGADTDSDSDSTGGTDTDPDSDTAGGSGDDMVVVSLDDPAIFELVGEAEGDRAGWSVAGVGDVDGDGWNDLLIGAESRGRPYDGAGGAYLVRGPVTESSELGSAYAIWTGEGETNAAGRVVAGAGDVDGNGFADVIIGAHMAEDESGVMTGAAYLYYGPVTAGGSLADADVKLAGEALQDHASTSLAGGADVNGDSLSDILVGAPGNSTRGEGTGAVYLLYGPVTTHPLLSASGAVLYGSGTYDGAGMAVGMAGDVDADGYSDVLVGANTSDYSGSQAGMAYLSYGPVSGYRSLSTSDVTFMGAAVGDLLGWPVDTAGDTNGDGYDDVLIGSTCDDEGGVDAGAVYLLTGPAPTGGLLSDWTAKIIGEEAGDWAGWSAHGAEDIDGDGSPDLVVGAEFADEVGAAYLLFGPLTGVRSLSSADYKFTVDGADGLAAIAPTSTPDVDGDGHPDVLIGTGGNRDAGLGAGAAFLVSSSFLR